MRMMRFAVAGTALAVAGMLAVCADPASAASSRARASQCTGKYQALENGQCVNTKFVNPDRIPDPCAGGAVCYRSSKHKKH